jgi:hypothetical protein
LCRFLYSTLIISAVLLLASPLPFLFSVVHSKNEQDIFKTLEPPTEARVRFNTRLSKFHGHQAQYLPFGPPLHLKTSIKSSLLRPLHKTSRFSSLLDVLSCITLRHTLCIARQIQSKSGSSSLPKLSIVQELKLDVCSVI